jgi:hypothetical protein
MSEDVREAILARMFIVFTGITGEIDVARNQIFNDDGSPRRLALLDGAEDIVPDDGLSNRPALSQRIMRMYPLTLVGSAAKAKDIGSDVSTRRRRIITAIEGDSTLQGLTYKGKGGRYVGIENTLALGILTLDQTALKFEFTYVLRPSQF